ncbi:MAG: WD40/YVTN/BNR-like repeat-containing protein, partial [Planctomycetia bacterium]
MTSRSPSIHRSRLSFVGRLSAVAATFAVFATGAAAVAADLKSFDDAALHAVQFIDEHEGWAVGDQGVVWHTMDGGVEWERQSTGTRATLTALQMKDYRTGWIAARESLPYNPGTNGVLLWTRDGGGRWLTASKQYLSGLHAVRFTDLDHGFAFGDSTDQHPAGLFATTDGARSWQPIRGVRSPGWTDGAFAPDGGVLVGHGGLFATIVDGRVRPVGGVDWLPNTTVRATTAAGGTLWAVGDQAQVVVSRDAGKTWRKPPVGIPAEIRRSWDFQAVAAVGDTHVWVVGRPGGVILHSWDGGLTWKFQKTGVPTPLHGVHFVDPLTGWACGALGVLLKTVNGGESWTVQKRGAEHAALLTLSADGRSVPLSMVAAIGGDEGYLTASMQLVGPDVNEDAPAVTARPGRFADAVRAAGGGVGETSTRFPLPQALTGEPVAVALAKWNSLHENDAAQEIERELVLALRLWRPAVVVTDGVEPSASTGELAAFVAQGVRKAFTAAADPTAFPELESFFGLAPHAAKKL